MWKKLDKGKAVSKCNEPKKPTQALIRKRRVITNFRPGSKEALCLKNKKKKNANKLDLKHVYVLAKLVVNSPQFRLNLPCLLGNAWPQSCEKIMEHIRLHAEKRLKICRIFRFKLSQKSIVLPKQASSQYSVSDPPPSSSWGSLLLLFCFF